MCSDEHVASLCAQLERDNGESMSRDWSQMSVRMFSGLPGLGPELELSRCQLLAAT